jgi:hypothetical protein
VVLIESLVAQQPWFAPDTVPTLNNQFEREHGGTLKEQHLIPLS